MQVRSLSAVIVLFVVVVALLFQQGYFASSVDLGQRQTLFINTSCSEGITHNRQGIKKAVG